MKLFDTYYTSMKYKNKLKSKDRYFYKKSRDKPGQKIWIRQCKRQKESRKKTA